MFRVQSYLHVYRKALKSTAIFGLILVAEMCLSYLRQQGWVGVDSIPDDSARDYPRRSLLMSCGLTPHLIGVQATIQETY